MSEDAVDISSILDEIKAKIDPMYGKTIDCDAGWHHLVAQCHMELSIIDPNYKVFQIKEKFGALRYYFDTRSGDFKEMEMWKIAQKYELASREVCELTGKPGKLMYKEGLYKTLAEEFEKDGWEKVEAITADRIFGVEPQNDN